MATTRTTDSGRANIHLAMRNSTHFDKDSFGLFARCLIIEKKLFYSKLILLKSSFLNCFFKWAIVNILSFWEKVMFNAAFYSNISQTLANAQVTALTHQKHVISNCRLQKWVFPTYALFPTYAVSISNLCSISSLSCKYFQRMLWDSLL